MTEACGSMCRSEGHSGPFTGPRRHTGPLTLQPEGSGDPTAGLAPPARPVQGVQGPRIACPPELADFTPALFWQLRRVSVCVTKGRCLSVGCGGDGRVRVSLWELDMGSAFRFQHWLLGCSAASLHAWASSHHHIVTSRPCSSSSGCDGVTARGAGRKRCASRASPVPGSSRSVPGPPWEFCVLISVGQIRKLSLGRGSVQSLPADGRRRRPPLRIPVTPRCQRPPKPRPQHTDDRGVRAPGSGVGD